MNMVVVSTLISSLMMVIAALLLLKNRKKVIFDDGVFKVIFSFILVNGLYFFTIFLEWSGVIHEFGVGYDQAEDFIGVLLPVMWILLFYTLMSEYTNLKLKEQEESYKELVETMQAGFAMIDETFRITMVNSYICKKLGYTEEELWGEQITSFILPEELPHVIETLKSMREDPFELEFVRKTGESLFIIIAPHFIFANNKLKGAFAVITDITEKKKTEQALIRLTNELEDKVIQRTKELELATQKAEEANRTKSIFLANMSHELRTPLNAILGYAQLMYRKEKPGSQNSDDLQTILNSGNHLLGLINDVLAISKIEAGRVSIAKNPFNPDALLKEIKSMFQFQIMKKKLEFIVTAGENLSECVNSDEKKIRQIIINLVNNAIKFTEKGEVRLNIETRSVDEQSGELIITVEDTGPGIPEKELPKIFDTFHQTDNSRQPTDGVGLGLSITKNFTTLLEGEINITSEMGKGTSFKVTLPSVFCDSEELGRKDNKFRITGFEADSDMPAVLVADDVESSRKYLYRLLTPMGFSVTTVINGAEAVESWMKEKHDLVLMDIRMPVMNGVEATKKIIENDEEAKVIILTASTFQQKTEELYETGCSAVLYKPVDENVLLQKIADICSLSPVYEKLNPKSKRSDGVFEPVNESDFAEFDQALIKSLYNAALLGDRENISRIAGQIEEKKPELAKKIKYYMTKYDYDIILNATENFSAE